MYAIILTGGSKEFSRLLADFRSRSLVSIAGKKLVDIILDAVSKYYDRIIIVYDDPTIAKHAMALNIDNLETVEQRGLGIESAICSAIPAVRDSLHAVHEATIFYGDIFSLEEFYQLHAKNLIRLDKDIVTLTIPYRVYPDFLRLSLNEEGVVDAVGDGEYIYAGAYTPFKLEHVREMLCKKSLTFRDYLSLIASEGKLNGIVWYDEWIDIDTPWDYLVANQYALSRLRNSLISSEASVSSTAVIEHPVIVEKGARIDHYAIIKGPVFIGREVYVGSHAIVRESATLLEGSQIGAYSNVKRSIIMEHSYVSDHVYIVDSVIGQRSVISPFTVTYSIPSSEAARKIALSFSLKHGEVKIGAAVTARKKIDSFTTLEPASTY